ncbi:MAG: hypothetical protein U0X91_03570 [Spirosomataceae bacterium]
MRKFFFSSVILVLLFEHRLIAQKPYIGGYVITLKGDTLYGLIRSSSGQLSRFQKCYFKKNYSSTPTIYNPNEIVRYNYENGKSLLSVSYQPTNSKVPKQVFMEYIIIGKLSLLRLKNEFFLYNEKKVYPLLIATKEVRGEDKNYIKTTLLFQDVVHNLIKPECPDVIYHGKQIKENALIEVVKSYHECLQLPYYITSTAKKRNSLHFYLYGGVQQMNMKLPTYGQKIDLTGVYYNEPGMNTTALVTRRIFAPTIGLEWHLSKLSNRIGIIMEISRFKLSSLLDFRFDNYNYQKDFGNGVLSHEYKLFKINPALKFYLNDYPNRLYTRLGAAFYSVQNEKSYLTLRSEITTDPLVLQKTLRVFNQENAISINKRPLGFVMALGIDMPVLYKLKAFAEIKAENMYMSYQAYSFLTNAHSVDINNSFLSLSVNLGVKF